MDSPPRPPYDNDEAVHQHDVRADLTIIHCHAQMLLRALTKESPLDPGSVATRAQSILEAVRRIAERHQ